MTQLVAKNYTKISKIFGKNENQRKEAGDCPLKTRFPFSHRRQAPATGGRPNIDAIALQLDIHLGNNISSDHNFMCIHFTGDR